MTPKAGRLGVFPLDPGRLGGAVAHPVIPSSFSLTEFVPVALWATNGSGSCVAMAGAWERFTGRPPEAAAGDGWLAFVHDDDRVRLKAAHIGAMARRERFEVEARFRKHDGSWQWIRIVAVPQRSEGVFEGFAGCAFDATQLRDERATSERDLRALRYLVDLSVDALLVADSRGRVERANAAGRRVVGNGAGVEGESLDLLVPGWRSLLAADTEAPITEVVRSDGSTVTTRGRALALPDPLGDRHLLALTRLEGLGSIEERRGMAPGRQAADLLHELSNVVTALLAGCELIRESVPVEHAALEELDVIEENVRRVRELTQALKPPERGKGEPDGSVPPRRREAFGGSSRPPLRGARRRRESERPEDVLRGLTILVVDDELSIRRTVRAALEAAGATVHDARQGADALLTWSELRGGVDLVITDLRMPEMGGEELGERLRMLRRDLPILFVSGYAVDRRVRRRPGDGFLAKPFGRDELLAAAGAVVRQPGAGV